MGAEADVRHAAGQVIAGGFDGKTVPDEFARLAREGMVGGAIVFARNIAGVEQAAELVRGLRALPAPAPMWVVVDQEGGRVQRLRAPFPELPPMREIGRTGAEAVLLAEHAARILAEGLSLIGVHQDYAPVLDVDTNPANPVIGDRAFSHESKVVGAVGSAFIRELQAGGIAACGKHFPGHGDTNKDSHLELPRLDHGLERLRHVELEPFRAAAEAGVAAIMTAHVVFAAIDDAHPATLSERVVEPILRKEIGFRGVIVSDDLEMKAVADHYGIEDAAVRAIRAGCDQLLICHEVGLQAAAYEALVRAVEQGSLSSTRLLEAASRVRQMKTRFGSRPAPAVYGGDLTSRLAALGASWTERWSATGLA